VKNVSTPESALHKKHNTTSCRAVGEATAMGALRAGKEDATTNLADGFTKVQLALRRKELFSCVARWIEDEETGVKRLKPNGVVEVRALGSLGAVEVLERCH
jgi:hypothetical protein